MPLASRFIVTGFCTLLLLILTSHASALPARQALRMQLPDVKFTGVALSDAIDFLRDVSNANIHVNWRALEEVGVERETLVNVRLNRVTLGKVLGLILTDAGSGNLLTYYASDGIIHVTTRELADRDMVLRVYPVDDLLMEIPDFIAPSFELEQTQTQTVGRGGGGGGGGQSIFQRTDIDEPVMTKAERADELIDLIVSTVQPDIWAINGGTAAIRFFQGSLIVTAPRSVHEALGGYVD